MRVPFSALLVGVFLALAPGLALAGGRVALVVANANYPSAPLANPVTDAKLVADSLKSIGFDVDVVTDANLAAFDGAVGRFSEKAAGSDVALFYFAGHGFAVNDGLKPRNYLLATEADVASRSDRVLRAGGIPLDEIVAGLSGKSKATLVFIDACRNDPRVSRAVGGTGRGLARVDVENSPNIFVGLSTRLGTVAADGKAGEGSPFARAFAANMVRPGQRLDDAFTELRKAVSAETNREQLPEVVQNDLDQAMVLVSAPAAVPETPQVEPAGADRNNKPAQPDPRLVEAGQIWPTIETSTSLETLKTFRDRYGGTFYSELADKRIAELEKEAAAQSAEESKPAAADGAQEAKPAAADGSQETTPVAEGSAEQKPADAEQEPKKDAAEGDQGGETQKLAALDNGTAKEAAAPAPGSSIALAGHTDMVREIAFTPDGKLIASVSNDRTVRIWDGNTGAELRKFDTDNYLVAVSADNRLVAMIDQGQIEIRDINSGELTASLPTDKFDFVSLAFSPDGSLLAGGGFGLDDNAIRIFDVAEQKRIRIIKGNTNTVQRVAFLSDGHRLLADSADRSIRIFDVSTGRQLSGIRLPVGSGGVQSSEMSPDETLIASGTVKTILRVWNAETGKLVTEWNGEPDNAAVLAWAPSGEIIAYAGGPGGAIHLWSPKTQRVVSTLEGHAAPVNTLAFSKDGTRLVSGSSDGSIRLWTLDQSAMAAQ